MLLPGNLSSESLARLPQPPDLRQHGPPLALEPAPLFFVAMTVTLSLVSPMVSHLGATIV